MRRAIWAVALLTAAVPASARAADTFRLAINAPASPTGFAGGADTVLVGGRGYGYGYGYGYGHHHGYYHHHYSYSPSFYGYYRPYYYSYPRYSISLGLGYYRPYAYYAPPAYYYSAPSYYYSPISLTTTLEAQTSSVGGASYSVTRPGAERLPPPLPKSSDGTFPYDGGPDNPVPMPKAEPDPASTPRLFRVPETRPVSLPAKGGKFSYPAYGEER